MHVGVSESVIVYVNVYVCVNVDVYIDADVCVRMGGRREKRDTTKHLAS